LCCTLSLRDIGIDGPAAHCFLFAMPFFFTKPNWPTVPSFVVVVDRAGGRVASTVLLDWLRGCSFFRVLDETQDQIRMQLHITFDRSSLFAYV
jgi:hypothetical protein